MSKYVYNNSGVTKTWAGMEVSAGSYYTLQIGEDLRWLGHDNVIVDLASGNLIVSTLASSSGHISSQAEAIRFLEHQGPPNPKTTDYSDIVAVNRVGAGYAVASICRGDDIPNKVFNAGPIFKLTNSTPVYGQFLNHWYATSAKLSWTNGVGDDTFEALLIAPATQGLTAQASGDYVLTGPLIKPVTVGTGTHVLSLTDKIGSSNVLKCTPVPSAGNTGWFNYSSTTNTLTTSMDQKGGYNLYNIDINLHRFANICSSVNNDFNMATDGYIGKLMLNTWQLKMTMTRADLSSAVCYVHITGAFKGNV